MFGLCVECWFVPKYVQRLFGFKSKPRGCLIDEGKIVTGACRATCWWALQVLENVWGPVPAFPIVPLNMCWNVGWSHRHSKLHSLHTTIYKPHMSGVHWSFTLKRLPSLKEENANTSRPIERIVNRSVRQHMAGNSVRSTGEQAPNTFQISLHTRVFF